MAFKDYTRYYKVGNSTAELHSHRGGYSITYFRNGREFAKSDFLIKNGYNRNVGRIEALRELKRFNYKSVK